jgi:polyketide cyclase/dehydrase/lipid transport protein
MTGTAVTGPRRPDEVWERYQRFDRWAEWSPYVREVAVDGDVLGTGVTGRLLGWLGTEAEFVVDTWDPSTHTWTWTLRARLTLPAADLPPLRLGHGVRPAGAGSRAWLTLRGPGPLVYGAFLPGRLTLYRLVH